MYHYQATSCIIVHSTVKDWYDSARLNRSWTHFKLKCTEPFGKSPMS